MGKAELIALLLWAVRLALTRLTVRLLLACTLHVSFLRIATSVIPI
ncbi:MAG: hypothetical protein IJU76_04060 [Desulfovibrionaceae bacterium]|nr:hypothetical protein [Desulfovibrionaceae bacterium]